MTTRLSIKFTSVLYNVNIFNQLQGQDDLLPPDIVAVLLLLASFCTVKTNKRKIRIPHSLDNNNNALYRDIIKYMSITASW